MKRRHVVIAGVLVAGAALGVWWWRRAPEGFIAELAALDDGSAILLWRYNPMDGRSREWIARVDADGNLDWKRELPAVATLHGLYVIGGLATVRYSHEEDDKEIDHAVAAYALDDGHLAWDTVLATEKQPDRMLPEPFLTASAAGGVLIEQVLERDPFGAVLYAVDPSSGRVVGSVKLASHDPHAPLVVGDRLVLHDILRAQDVVDPTHGLAVGDLKIEAGGIGCVIGDEYVSAAYETIVAFRHADAAARRVVGTLDPGLVSRCGHHGDRMVFAMQSLDRHELIAVTDRDGKLLATIPLVGTLSTTEGPAWPADVRMFSGTLPRFVPRLSIVYADNDIRQRLAMLDLDEGRVAWTATGRVYPLGAVFHTGDRWYLTDATGGDLAAFDGATGKLVAAVRGGERIEPSQVAGGKIWLYTNKWGRLDKPPLAVVDAKTLAPLFTRGIDVSDVTAKTRTELGIPGVQ